MVTDTNRAPGHLEEIRLLVNSWLIPNDTRVATDRLAMHASARGVTARAQVAQLRAWRDDLRAIVEGGAAELGRLATWIRRADVRPVVTAGVASVGFVHAGSVVGGDVVIVLEALRDGTWSRLKACPDCRWVFFDHSRNASKRWCLMTAGASGRACGTLDKVRAFRARQKKNAKTTTKAQPRRGR